MVKILTTLAQCLFIRTAFSVNVDRSSEGKSSALAQSDAAYQGSRLLGGASFQSLASAFARSEKVHMESMAAISSSLSIKRAADVLMKSSMVSPTLTQITNMALGKQAVNETPGVGYSGVDDARKLLNDMIFESMSKYDAEIAKCTGYYNDQCGELELCRGEISGANYIAANARALILDAQTNIHRCQSAIPSKKFELKQHTLKCENEMHKMRQRLEIVAGDIETMTMILEMTDCDKSFVQKKGITLLHCIDPCTNKTFVSFQQNELQAKVGQLKSKLSQDLLSESFKDLLTGVSGIESLAFPQTRSEQLPVVNKTDFNNPPVPVTKVPSDPCNDPDAGAPSKSDKRAAKCSFGKSPQCYKLQERFLLIQAGIADERDELLDEINMLEKFCEETKATLEKQIADDQALLEQSQTKLAAATEKEATAAEIARTTAAEFEKLDTDLVKQMKTCQGNYINFETEICALKKIRGELYKLKGTDMPFFQDCEMSGWDPEECSVKCGGGSQQITRSVLTHPDGGAKCLPLVAVKTCNSKPCPVDCYLSEWSGWSKCSADCGGGVQQKIRAVKVPMKFGGHPCGATSIVDSCNNQACEKDCELSDWTKWTDCSKDCDGGTQKRLKFITHAAEGDGKCADSWSSRRLQYKHCNMNRCETIRDDIPLLCNKSLDVILLLDGSGSLGERGWKAEIHAAKVLIMAFLPAHGRVNFAVILFSGPKTWSGVSKCTGKSVEAVSQKDCGITTVTHFDSNIRRVEGLISGLQWPQGSTLTSLALMTAKAEMSLGRADTHTIIIVITDGRPMSYRKTAIASKLLRKSARLLWIPVTKFAPLKEIKNWATRRWQENVVKVEDFDDLRSPSVITHVIADICPNDNPTIRFQRDQDGAINTRRTGNSMYSLMGGLDDPVQGE